MSEEKNGFLQDGAGDKSSTRLQSVLTLVFAFLIGGGATVMAFIKGGDDIGPNIVVLVLGLVSLAFGHKQIGKYFENKEKQIEQSENK